MTSQVFYRKWRPKKFSQLVGQEPISATLRQAVKQGRVGHAYLFCGPRGTGKTSTARILAKAVNCLNPQDGEPCDQCGPCQAINEGRFTDLIELDAASNRGIDEIRNIRDKVHFAPSEGRYKFYIIDEAHMLTEHAANAFLKTLEEPPPHVVFALCTTEAHKVLATIVSRCQRFDFRRLSLDSVVAQLQWIATEEAMEADPEALKALARAAGGSLRDAENLLEQMMVSHGRKLTLQDVQEALGLRGSEEALELVRHLLKANVAEALAAINRAVWNGLDARQLHRHTVDYLRGVLVVKCGAEETLDLPAETLQHLRALADSAPLPRIIQALKRMGEVSLRYDSVTTLPLELAAVEACMPEAAPAASAGASTLPERSTHSEMPRPPRNTQPSAPRPTLGEGRPGPVIPTAPATAPSQAEPPPPGTPASSQWESIIKSLSRYKGKRFNIGALLRDCKTHYREGDVLVLVFNHRSHLERMQEELEDPRCRSYVESVFAKLLTEGPCSLKLTLADGNGSGSPAATQSHLVRAALGLGAKIVQEENGDDE